MIQIKTGYHLTQRLNYILTFAHRLKHIEIKQRKGRTRPRRGNSELRMCPWSKVGATIVSSHSMILSVIKMRHLKNCIKKYNNFQIQPMTMMKCSISKINNKMTKVWNYNLLNLKVIRQDPWRGRAKTKLTLTKNWKRWRGSWGDWKWRKTNHQRRPVKIYRAN